MKWDPQRLETVPGAEDPIAWVRYARACPLDTVKGRTTMLPTVGTHTAHAGERSVYESQSGALMLALRCEVDPNTAIVSHQCLMQKDGTPNQRTLDTLRQVFGWDGTDPFWLVDTDLSAVEFDIVVEPDSYEGKNTVRVAWINPKGSSHGGPLKSGDRTTILAKYGAKFRAVAGPQPVARAAAPKPQSPAAPPAPRPAAPAPRPPQPPNVPVAGASMEDAWKAFCNAPGAPANDQDTLTAKWYALVADLGGGRPQAELTREDWGRIKTAAANAWMAELPI